MNIDGMSEKLGTDERVMCVGVAGAGAAKETQNSLEARTFYETFVCRNGSQNSTEGKTFLTRTESETSLCLVAILN